MRRPCLSLSSTAMIPTIWTHMLWIDLWIESRFDRDFVMADTPIHPLLLYAAETVTLLPSVDMVCAVLGVGTSRLAHTGSKAVSSLQLLRKC